MRYFVPLALGAMGILGVLLVATYVPPPPCRFKGTTTPCACAWDVEDECRPLAAWMRRYEGVK